jgi:hypothetical protein
VIGNNRWALIAKKIHRLDDTDNRWVKKYQLDGRPSEEKNLKPMIDTIVQI